MTLKEAYEYGQERLNAAGIEEYSIDAWYLLEFVTGLDRTAYFLKSDEKITDEQGSLYKAYLEQRAQHIPLQHITGVQEFMGLEFAVNEHVLVPRQDGDISGMCAVLCSATDESAGYVYRFRLHLDQSDEARKDRTRSGSRYFRRSSEDSKKKCRETSGGTTVDKKRFI